MLVKSFKISNHLKILFSAYFWMLKTVLRLNSSFLFTESSTSGGLVFGIPLPQCVENDRLSRVAAGASPFRSRGDLSGSGDEPTIGRHASRASFSSLIDAPRGDDVSSLLLKFQCLYLKIT